MSMRQLGNHHVAKGVILNPARRAILVHLQVHGECTAGDLLQMLLDRRLATDDGLARNPYWLQKHLSPMRAKGHIDKRIDGYRVVWFAAESPVADEPEAPTPPPAPRVAAARQVNVMHGPVYQPVERPPARAGALDFTRVHSLIGGKCVPFTKQAPHP